MSMIERNEWKTNLTMKYWILSIFLEQKVAFYMLCWIFFHLTVSPLYLCFNCRCFLIAVLCFCRQRAYTMNSSCEREEKKEAIWVPWFLLNINITIGLFEYFKLKRNHSVFHLALFGSSARPPRTRTRTRIRFPSLQ